MKEGMDMKLAMLLYRKKIWISLIGALVGAVLAGGLYFLVHVVYAPAREYEAVSKLYLTFATEDDGDAYQYYNGYTWNDLMKTEPILDKIMEEIPAGTLSRDEVKEKIGADILSDIRLLTVTVRTHSEEDTEKLIRACENALVSFGGEMVEFEKIEVIDHGQAGLVVLEDETVRAVVAGLVIGFLLSLLWLAFARAWDDSIYVPSDFEKRYGYPVLGVKFKGNETAGKERLEENLQLLEKKGNDFTFVNAQEPDFTVGKSVVLEIPYGNGNGKLVERCIAQAKLRELEVLGAVITEADLGLYQLYFATFDKKKRNKS